MLLSCRFLALSVCCLICGITWVFVVLVLRRSCCGFADCLLMCLPFGFCRWVVVHGFGLLIEVSCWFTWCGVSVTCFLMLLVVLRF